MKKNSKKRLSTHEYNQVFINNVIEHLSSGFHVSTKELSEIKRKFTQSINEDSNYVLHYSSEYWAKFIAESAELKRKTSLAKV